MSDMSRGKQAEEIRQKSHEWEVTFNSITDLVSIHDKNFRIIKVNKAFADAVGGEVGKLVGQNCFEIIHRTEEPWFHCPHKQTLENKKPVTEEFLEPNLGIYLQVSCSPIVDDRNEVIGSVHIARDITERKRAEDALQKAHDELERRVEERTEELRRVSSQLLKAHEEERRRIALEIHDGLGQTLSALKFRVEMAIQEISEQPPATGVKKLEPIVPMVQEAVEEVRRIQRNLRPPMLDDLGIVATISWFCREFEMIYPGIRIQTQMDIQENDVPDSLKIVIFRILQEGLNNIAKHGKATLARLSLRQMDGKIELAVQDNGAGFDVEGMLFGKSAKRGFGLVSMRERSELSGGSFSIESQRDSGTTLRASWPCN